MEGARKAPDTFVRFQAMAADRGVALRDLPPADLRAAARAQGVNVG